VKLPCLNQDGCGYGSLKYLHVDFRTRVKTLTDLASIGGPILFGALMA
jgi:hypothetical protein